MSLSLPALTPRVEEACLGGWPALNQIAFDGWLICHSDGYTRRANSVHSLRNGTHDLSERIEHCEQIYDARKLPTIFCIKSTMAPDLGHALDERGYHPPEDATIVLYNELNAGRRLALSPVEITEKMPSEVWLSTLGHLHGHGGRERIAHRRILEALSVPAAFAGVSVGGGRLAALAFGAVTSGIVCVNSVVTAPEFRRRGFAQEAISAILGWAASAAGASGACIPVVASNAPAVALYQRLGFRQEVYRYHYRRRFA